MFAGVIEEYGRQERCKRPVGTAQVSRLQACYRGSGSSVQHSIHHVLYDLKVRQELDALLTVVSLKGQDQIYGLYHA